MAELTLYSCCRPASGHIVRGVSERGPVINQGPHHIQGWTSIKEVWVDVLGFFMFLSAVFPRFSLILDPKDIIGVLGGKAGSACEEFENSEGGILGQCF